jgi:hypothetical protein
MEAFRGESLLAIATSVVGVLILLSVGFCQRAKSLVTQAEPVESAKLQAARQTETTLISDTNRLREEIQKVKQEAALRAFEREQLAVLIASADRELAERRAALDQKSRSQYDLNRDLALAKADLSKLEKQHHEIASEPERSVKLENYPTPLSKPVDNKEAHFQIKHGRIAYVPIEEMMGRLKSTVERKIWKLKDQATLTDMLGPVQGFNMRYIVERVDIPWEEAMHSGQSGSMIQLAKVEFLPTTSELGEPIEEALSNRSMFRGRLDECSPRQFTITLWVYPDSFAEFYRLRKVLYTLGYSIATRPLPDGIAIGGSPHGSKSSAQ